MRELRPWTVTLCPHYKRASTAVSSLVTVASTAGSPLPRPGPLPSWCCLRPARGPRIAVSLQDHLLPEPYVETMKAHLLDRCPVSDIREVRRMFVQVGACGRVWARACMQARVGAGETMCAGLCLPAAAQGH